MNWETPPIHPIQLSPDGKTLAVANLPAAQLELFSVDEDFPQLSDSIPVGLDPVTVRFRDTSQVWVVCHISDAVNVVDLGTGRVEAVISTQDGPCDVVFAGDPLRAYVSCSSVNLVQVFDPASFELLEEIPINGERPKAMSVSPDGSKVYVAVFESGNASTILTTKFGLKAVPGSVLDLHEGPYEGVNPPPNFGDHFEPEIVDYLTGPPPKVGLIVKKDQKGRWMDDNQKDWSEYVSGSKAPLSGRPIGWDMPDRDLAIIDTNTHEVDYVSRLMNICMDLAVNPITGVIAVVGTDAINEVRFEPNLNGRFLSVELALIDPDSREVHRVNLNPHLRDDLPTLPVSERKKSIGEPRSVVWSQDGQTLFIAGMGSDHVLKVDASGRRITEAPISVEGGPNGLALDSDTNRLFVYRRFSSKVSILDETTNKLTRELSLFDPTPVSIRRGRPFLYNTQLTSGTGHTSCASCHVDGRFDRLVWDLGSPEGRMLSIDADISFAGRFQPDEVPPFHPMKGPMMTMTLQDIIGHEPFHWRGDRFGIEAFNPTFTDLQGTAEELTHKDMADFKAFLATIHFPPNRYRTFTNDLSPSVPLPDHFALGRDRNRNGLALGQPFGRGNARAGLRVFRSTGNCNECHTFSTGLGPHMLFEDGKWREIPNGPMNERHVSLVQQPRSGNLPFKIASLRGMADKVGADFTGKESRVGFGFAHHGGVDSLTRFIQDGFNFVDDKSTADLIALLLSFTGAELNLGDPTDELKAPGLLSLDTHAAVGRQFLIIEGQIIPEDLTRAIGMTDDRTDPIDLIAYQRTESQSIGWFFEAETKSFLPDGPDSPLSLEQLMETYLKDGPLLFMVVPPGTGQRMALDWDLDGFLNREELAMGLDPLSSRSTPVNQAPVIKSIDVMTVRPGQTLDIDFQVEDMNDPPDPVTLKWVDTSDQQPALDGPQFQWVAPPTTSDEPYWFEIEAADQGDPPLSQRMRFPVFVMEAVNSPVLKSTEITDERIVLAWEVEPGMTVQVLFAEDIQHPVWLPLIPPRLALEPHFEVSDALRFKQPRFYRIAQLNNGSRRSM